MTASLSPPVLAFFDVDETLIDQKSMFTFMRFFLRERYGAVGGLMFAWRMRFIRRMSMCGWSREVVNRRYYGMYEGVRWDALAAAGRRWFAAQEALPGFYIQSTRSELAALKKRGYQIVLVSGSFHPCLTPLAERVGADYVLCTELEVVRGRITGRLLEQTIGDGKAKVVERLMAMLGSNRSQCIAFGDHISDLQMLEAVGSAVVVGSRCAELVELARQRNWTINTI
ncbi:HAD family hydrolase [Paraburkholderia denitrificans]|uniref:HAD family hydrolase n=1 Tax=Paraburkholderia denitrificans TaxID=694025 RepID=A0ABW0J741_9BURK